METRSTSLPVHVLPQDAEARQFLSDQDLHRRRRCQWWLRGLLRPFLGDFALNGLLGTYPLFLLGTSQWQQLLDRPRGGRLLDIGAACGDVTRALAPLVDEVTATEVNRPMVRALRARGVDAHLLDLTDDEAPGAPFDLVTLLNVLDRCERPLTLLSRAVDAVAAGGTLAVSVPLPYRPCWYDGPARVEPRERLPIATDDPEAGLRALATLVASHGLEVTALARAPYLSGGDRRRAHYRLDAAIVIARQA